jgi:SAM-dependent methyltransferase
VTDNASDRGHPAPKIDTTVPHSARIWNYWLGGKDNYPVDREAGDQFVKMFPQIVDVARASRGFLGRAVRYLAADAHIRQFLDIGTGLPSQDNTHEVAQRVAPECRIVYVDNDPLVLAHARALLVSAPAGATDYIDADLLEPSEILLDAARTLDFRQPVALILGGVLGHLTDDEKALAVVRRLLNALCSGSYLVLCDGTNVVRGGEGEQAQQDYNEGGAAPYRLRSPEQLGRFFDGLELVEPGLVSCPRWRPEAAPFGEPPEIDAFCAVGRKP